MNTKKRIAAGTVLAMAAIIYAVTNGLGEDFGGRVSVSGAVRVQGQPVEEGRIRFTPDVNTEGTIAWGAIERGRYNVPRAEGPLPGRYTVTVLIGPSLSKEQRLKALKSEKRSRKGQLVSVLQPIDIEWAKPVEISPSESKNTLDFDLPG